MARTTPRPLPTATRTLQPLGRHCPLCGETMWVAYHNSRVVYLSPADKYPRLTWSTVKGSKRSIWAGSHGLPAVLSPLVTPSALVVWTHGACASHPSLLLPTPAACSHPRWLGPRGHPIQQHLTQRPDMIGEPRRHRWRLRPHCVAAPVPWVRTGCGTGWRTLACGRTKLSYT